MKKMLIGDRVIGPDSPPYVIAEISGNHNGSLDRAMALVLAAQQAGADAVKLQTYTADTLTLNSRGADFQIESGLWQGKTLYDLYEWAHTPWSWHKPLFDYARGLGIPIFSSPFDASAVELLESLSAPAYKIASFEAVDLDLVRCVGRTGKPVIVSTGMSNLEEIGEAVQALESVGCQQYALLHCVSGYPAPPSDYNLRTMEDLSRRFGCPVGLSDHTLGLTTAYGATALGASLIEKHMTLKRSDGGPDAAFSSEPDELSQLVANTHQVWQSLGSVTYERASSEQENLRFRRSLYFVKDLKRGERITEDALRSVRPGFGLKPKYRADLIGLKVAEDVEKNTPVRLKFLQAPGAHIAEDQ